MPGAGNFYVVTLRGDRGPLDRQSMVEHLRAGEIHGQDQVRNAFGRPLGTVTEVLGGDSRRMPVAPRSPSHRPVPHPHPHPHHAPPAGPSPRLIAVGILFAIAAVGLAYLIIPDASEPARKPSAPTPPRPGSQATKAVPRLSPPKPASAGQPGLLLDVFRFNYTPQDFPLLAAEAKSDWSGAVAEVVIDSCTKAGFNENFSARWQGRLEIVTPGRYTFYLSSDDGSRLTIDDQVLIDNGGSHGMQEAIGTKELSAGLHPIRLDYFQGIGLFGLQLEWQGGTASRSPLPATALSHVGP